AAELVAVPGDRHERRVEAPDREGPLLPDVVRAADVPPLVDERLLVRRMHCRPVAVHVERTQLDALWPDRGRLQPGDVDDHAEEAPDADIASTREEGGRR